jgi:hypothetical protein
VTDGDSSEADSVSKTPVSPKEEVDIDSSEQEILLLLSSKSERWELTAVGCAWGLSHFVSEAEPKDLL